MNLTMMITSFINTILLLIGLQSCQQIESKNSAEMLEIFKVEYDGAEIKPTELRYKEIKYFRPDGKLKEHKIFSVDNKIKGFEVVNHTSDNKAISNYFSADTVLLAIYHYEYDGTQLKKKMGYDGQSKELLRIEHFYYNAEGNRSKKEIADASDNLTQTIDSKYDGHSNELKYSSTAPDGQLLNEEQFVIKKMTDDNQWLEKIGYKNELPSSFHRRTLITQ